MHVGRVGSPPVRSHDVFLEVGPILIGVPILVFTWHRFPLTNLSYRLILFHALVLELGGHYTYEKVPIGFWFKDAFDLGRNHYDRFGDPWDTQKDMLLAPGVRHPRSGIAGPYSRPAAREHATCDGTSERTG